MRFAVNKTNYSGIIKKVQLGEALLPLGGEAGFPFYFFEAQRGAQPQLALEIWDTYSDDWPCPAAYAAASLASPAVWARAAVQAGAQAVKLELRSIDPNGQNAPSGQAVAVVGQILDAIDVPLLIWGSDNAEKDGEVLSAIGKAFSGKKLVLAPVVEANYQLLAPAAIEYGHTLVASSPIDINLAKQLSILLQNQGVAPEQILLDPTTGGLGYGLEYTYSVMERMRIAGLQQNDQTLSLPLVCSLGKEIWKSKEARQSARPEDGIMMEISAGVSLLLAGANLITLSHPQSLSLLREFITELYKSSRLETTGLL